jgi:hypothetical protein
MSPKQPMLDQNISWKGPASGNFLERAASDDLQEGRSARRHGPRSAVEELRTINRTVD